MNETYVMGRSKENGNLWALWRQDDNGHRFLIAVRETREGAEAEHRAYERMAHKQFYWIEPHHI